MFTGPFAPGPKGLADAAGRKVPDVTESFDEDRFAALLDLAGPDMAAELTRRLDEDLTNVGLALAMAHADRAVLQAQSHILVSIAGTIGATRLFQLAKQFHALAVQGESGGLAAALPELRKVLNDVILRIKSDRFGRGTAS